MAVEIAHFGRGGGLPVLLLHEGLGSVAMWRDFPEKLSERVGRHVIVWSRRGYGNSGNFIAPYSVDYMHHEADATDALMRDLGVPRAHIIGHSDGASISLLLAARHPQRAASLILEAPHVFVERMCLDAISAIGDVAKNSNFIERLGRYHHDAASVFRQWFDIWMTPEFAAWNIENQLEPIDCPALLIQGENDEYGTFEQIERLKMSLKLAQELRLPECRHSPHRDQEKAVLSSIAAFLEDVGDD